MDYARTEKPGIEEWTKLADNVIARLTECVRVYKRPPYNDVFMAEAERQTKTHEVVGYLRRLHTVIDQTGIPTTTVSDVHVHDERAIDALDVLFREALRLLPGLSADMQKLLKSHWADRFPNQSVRLMFAGDDDSRGIGSGYADQGHLPGALRDLMERENMGDARPPRQDLLRHGEPRRNDAEARRRWGDQNAHFLRTAGRVE